jgi:hypothetical protein
MRRDIIALVVLFALLAALIALGPGQGDSAPGAGPSSHASSPGGALALHRWLADLGYEVARLEYAEFAPEPDADLLVVLGPSERYDREEAEAVRAWVEAGGTLLVAEERPGQSAPAAPLLAAFDLAIVPAAEPAPAELAPVLQPALGAPVARTLEVMSGATVAGGASAAPLAGASEAPVLVGLQYGEGYVYASAATHPFTNLGLRHDDNGAMVLNLLRRVPPGGRVVFDEVHHGFVGQPSLRGLLLGTPWGLAALYAALVCAGYLVLTGRRFGRPVPLRAEVDRRSSAEYLASLAGLLRRAGKRSFLLEHYRAGFKRRIARTHGLSPDLDDQALVGAIALSRPAEAQAVAGLLARMAQPANEADLLMIVRDADALLER